jgi:hypothetical protein
MMSDEFLPAMPVSFKMAAKVRVPGKIFREMASCAAGIYFLM